MMEFSIIIMLCCSVLKVTTSRTLENDSSNTETLDGLRQRWMAQEQVRMSLVNEISSLESDIHDAHMIRDSMNVLSSGIDALNWTTGNVLKSIKEIKVVDPLVKIEGHIEAAKKEIQEKKIKLQEAEFEMEDLWMTPEFRLALDSILKRELLTPSPKAPNPYNNKIWKEALESREEFFKEEEKRLESIREKIAEMTNNIKVLYHNMSQSKIITFLRQKFTLLHNQLDTFSRKHKKSSEARKTIAYIKSKLEEFEKNQRKEFELESKLNMKTGVERLEKIIELSDDKQKPLNEMIVKRLGNDKVSIATEADYQEVLKDIKNEFGLKGEVNTSAAAGKTNKTLSKTATSATTNKWSKYIPEKVRKYMAFQNSYEGIPALLQYEHGAKLDADIEKISKKPLEIVEIYKRIAFNAIRRIRYDSPKVVRTFFGDALQKLLFKVDP